MGGGNCVGGAAIAATIMNDTTTHVATHAKTRRLFCDTVLTVASPTTRAELVGKDRGKDGWKHGVNCKLVCMDVYENHILLL